MRRTNLKGVLLAGIAVGLFVTAGCSNAPKPGSLIRGGTERVESQRMTIGQSVNGAPLVAEMFGGRGDVVLIIGGMHGSEPAGPVLLREMGQRLVSEPQAACGRRVLVLALANPDGADKHQRGNAHGVDLNRNFASEQSRLQVPSDLTPGRAQTAAPFSEPETRAIRDLILQYAPIRIISLHQAADCLDYDGPPEAQRIASAMAAVSDLPVRKMGARPASLGTYAGQTLGVPVITVELPAYASTMDGKALWEQYGRMMLKGICWPE